MTNRDKFFEVFGFHADYGMNILPCTNECPYLEVCKESVIGSCDSFGEDWWNAEYKEPTKNDLGVDVPDNNVGNIDCISREQAKAAIRNRFKDLPSRVEINTILNELPPASPQEPFINKPCVSSGVCEHDKQKMLNIIIAEIKELDTYYVNDFYLGNMDAMLKRDYVLHILDKYKAESEDT